MGKDATKRGIAGVAALHTTRTRRVVLASHALRHVAAISRGCPAGGLTLARLQHEAVLLCAQLGCATRCVAQVGCLRRNARQAVSAFAGYR